MDLFSLLPTSHNRNYYSGVIPSIPSIMASERLNLPPVPSVTHITQPANEDTALFTLQSVLKTGAHLPAGKWMSLIKLLWDSPPNPGPFYRAFREWTAPGRSRNIKTLVDALLRHYGEFNTIENPYPSTIQALARRLSSEAAVATLEDRQRCDADTRRVQACSLENDYQEGTLGMLPARRDRRRRTACAWRASLASARAPACVRDSGPESKVHQLALPSCGAGRSSFSPPPHITGLR